MSSPFCFPLRTIIKQTHFIREKQSQETNFLRYMISYNFSLEKTHHTVLY